MEGKDKFDNKNIESISSDTEEINEEISEEEEEISIENIHIQKWFCPEKYNTINEAEFIEISNILSEPINEIYLKMGPLELFLEVIDEFIEKIAFYTNEYLYKRYNEKSNYSKENIIRYLYVYLFLSVYNLPEIDTIWENSNLFSTSVSQIISKNHFKKINKVFSISKYNDQIKTPNINNNNKFEKID